MVLGSDRTKQIALDISAKVNEVRRASSSLENLAGSLSEVAGAGQATDSELGSVNRELQEMAASTQAANSGLTSLQSQMVATDALAERLDDSLEELDFDQQSFSTPDFLSEGGSLDTVFDFKEAIEKTNNLTETIDGAERTAKDVDLSEIMSGFSPAGRELDAASTQLARLTQEMDSTLAVAQELGGGFEEEIGELFEEASDLPTKELATFFSTFKTADDASEALELFNKRTSNQAEQLEETLDVVDEMERRGVPQQIAQVEKLLSGQQVLTTPFDEDADQFRADVGLRNILPDTLAEDLEEQGIRSASDLVDAMGMDFDDPDDRRKLRLGKKDVPDRVADALSLRDIEETDILKEGFRPVPGAPGATFQDPKGNFVQAIDAIDDDFFLFLKDLQEAAQSEGELDIRNMDGLMDVERLFSRVLEEAVDSVEETDMERLGRVIEGQVKRNLDDMAQQTFDSTDLTRPAQLRRAEEELEDENVANLVANFRKLQNAAGAIDVPIDETKLNPEKVGNLGNFLAAVLDGVDDISQLTPRQARRRARKLLDPFDESVTTDIPVELPLDREQRGRAFSRVDDPGTVTRVDAIEQLFREIQDRRVDDEVLDVLAEGPSGDQRVFPLNRKGEGTFGFGRTDAGFGALLSELGIADALDSDIFGGAGSDIDAVGDPEEVAEALTEFAEVLEEFPEIADAFAELPDDADIFDIVNEVGGHAVKAVADWGEQYEEVFDELFDGEMLDSLLEKSDAFVQDRDDLRKAVRKFTNLSRAESDTLSNLLAEETSILGDEQRVVPREIVQGQILRRSADAESRERTNALRRLFNLVGQGQLGTTQSLLETERFIGAGGDDLGMISALRSQFEDTDLDENLREGFSEALAKQVQRDFERTDFTTFFEFVKGFDLSQSLGRAADDHKGQIDTEELMDPLFEALKSTLVAQMFDLDPDIANALLDTNREFDIDDVAETGDIPQEEIQLLREMKDTGIPGIPARAKSKSEFADLSDIFGKRIGGFADRNVRKPLQMMRTQLFRVSRAGGVTTKALRVLGFSIGQTADKTEDAVTSIADFHDSFMDALPTLGIASANLGSFNISAERGVALVKQMLALGGTLGTFVSLIGGLAAALGGATAAFGSFLAVGAFGVLEQMKDSMAGVTSQGEAMKQMMEALKEGISDAVTPLRRTEIGGSGMNAFQAFNAAIERTLSIINDLSKTFRAFIETSGFKEFAKIINERMPGVGPNDAFGEAFLKLAESGALERAGKVLAGVFQAVAGFVSFSAEIINILEGPRQTPGFFKTFSGLIGLLKVLTRITAKVISVISMVIGTFIALSDAVTNVIPGPLLGILSALLEVFGTSVGVVLAYTAAVWALTGAMSALTAVSAVQLKIALVLVVAWKAMKFIGENLPAIIDAIRAAGLGVKDTFSDIVWIMERMWSLTRKIAGALNPFSAFKGGRSGILGKATQIAVPGLDTGGLVTSSGLATIHKGERVVPEAQVTDRGKVEAQPTGGGGGGRRAARAQTVVVENNGVIGIQDIERRIERLIERKQREDSRRTSDRFIS